MLLGEQCRGHQQRDLLAVGERDPCGAQRDFGLAETHVAADEAVHRLARGQVLDHGLDRRCLIGRLLEGEALGERFVIMHAELERVALAQRALGIQIEQLRRGIVRLARRAPLRLFPLTAAQLVQRRRVG